MALTKDHKQFLTKLENAVNKANSLNQTYYKAGIAQMNSDFETMIKVLYTSSEASTSLSNIFSNYNSESPFLKSNIINAFASELINKFFNSEVFLDDIDPSINYYGSLFFKNFNGDDMEDDYCEDDSELQLLPGQPQELLNKTLSIWDNYIGNQIEYIDNYNELVDFINDHLVVDSANQVVSLDIY